MKSIMYGRIIQSQIKSGYGDRNARVEIKDQKKRLRYMKIMGKVLWCIQSPQRN